MPVCPKCHEKNPKLGAKCPRDGFYFIEEGALEEAVEDSRIGKLTADKFVIVDLISEGGMGAVYKAMQLPVEREVAVKVLRAELEDSDQGRDRFIREARAVSKLTHPNVITLHDFGFEDSGHPYMVMEYAPGVSLAGWLRKSDLTVSRIIHVLQQILSALSDAHKRGIVHRDLKPENLIVTQTGNDQDYIKLLDFGIARLVNEGSTKGLTREGEVFGTPHYMSPEQAQGSTDIGPPADVYALGIIAYELFAGAPPFDASTPLSVLYMHINDDLPMLHPRPGLSPPDAVRQVIQNATKKDPQERYQTAGEMLSDLNQRLEEEGAADGLPYSAGASQSGQFPARASVDESQESATAGASQERSAAGSTVLLDEPAEEDMPAESSDALAVKDDEKFVTAQTLAPSPPSKFDTEESLYDASERKKRIVLVAAGLLTLIITIGVAGAYLFGDEDASAPSDTATEAATAADDRATDDRASDDRAADDEKTEPSDPSDPTMATKGGSESEKEAQTEGTEPSDDSAERKKMPTGGGSADDEPKRARENAADPGAAEGASTTKPERRPTTETAEKPTSSESESAGSKEEEPEKFEPSKFRPAETSDEDDEKDEPDKFEPAKWR